MNDKAAGRFIAKNAPPGSILVDDGYSLRDPRFIGPPKGDRMLQLIHKGERAIVERFFGLLKTTWKMVGAVYRWKRKDHALVIRCAVILTNVLIVHQGGLNK